MNLYAVARRLWRDKVAVVSCAVIAAAIAILATYNVSFSPLSLRARALQMGVAQGSVLIDAGRSQLGNSRTNPDTLARLGSNLAVLSNTSPIIDPIAHALHVRPSAIGVEPQPTALIPLSQSSPLEPQVGNQILATRRRFLLIARNDLGTPVVQYYAQAPTGAQAVTVVRAAIRSTTHFFAGRVRAAHVLPRDAITVRSLGLISGQTLNRGVTRDAAILIGVFAWIVLMIAVLAILTQVRQSSALRRLAARTT